MTDTGLITCARCKRKDSEPHFEHRDRCWYCGDIAATLKAAERTATALEALVALVKQQNEQIASSPAVKPSCSSCLHPSHAPDQCAAVAVSGNSVIRCPCGLPVERGKGKLEMAG